MSTFRSVESASPQVSPGTYSPVTVYMQDSIGAVFLGIFGVIFLIGWLRSKKRCASRIEEK